MNLATLLTELEVMNDRLADIGSWFISIDRKVVENSLYHARMYLSEVMLQILKLQKGDL